jgi:two-component system, NtrC family, response regulator PilR
MSVISTNSLAAGNAGSPLSARVLVIDDEPDLRTLYELSLVREGYEVITAGTVAQSLAALQTQGFHAVVSDMQLPDGLGLEVLRFLATHERAERCVVITAHGSAENAVEALKAGAFDYLTKPVDLKQFRSVIAQAVRLGQHDASSAKSQVMASQPVLPTAQTINAEEHGPLAVKALAAIVGSSVVMCQLRDRITKVARSMAPVLVHGESGTGKELVARALHACSHRSEGPFVAVNCSAIPEHLLEAEFFGSRKGSFTGAVADRIGFFQAAQGGTLFLDEIGDLPLSMQAKLLRAIQERSVRALGDTLEQAVNVRIVSATHRDLVAAVAAQQFRQDLFYRIHVIDMTLPPLRERREDLPELVHCLLERIAHESHSSLPAYSPQLIEQLQSMPLDGNVRELENLLHRAVALGDGQGIKLESEPQVTITRKIVASTSEPMPELDLPRDLQAHLDQQERHIISQALKDTGFNRTAAAAKLGMSLRQIRYRMARLGIDDNDGNS